MAYLIEKTGLILRLTCSSFLSAVIGWIYLFSNDPWPILILKVFSAFAILMALLQTPLFKDLHAEPDVGVGLSRPPEV